MIKPFQGGGQWWSCATVPPWTECNISNRNSTCLGGVSGLHRSSPDVSILLLLFNLRSQQPLGSGAATLPASRIPIAAHVPQLTVRARRSRPVHRRHKANEGRGEDKDWDKGGRKSCCLHVSSERPNSGRAKPTVQTEAWTLALTVQPRSELRIAIRNMMQEQHSPAIVWLTFITMSSCGNIHKSMIHRFILYSIYTVTSGPLVQCVLVHNILSVNIWQKLFWLKGMQTLSNVPTD